MDWFGSSLQSLMNTRPYIQFSPSAVINGNFDADFESPDHILLFNDLSLDSQRTELEKKITAGDLKTLQMTPN